MTQGLPLRTGHQGQELLQAPQQVQRVGHRARKRGLCVCAALGRRGRRRARRRLGPRQHRLADCAESTDDLE